MSDYFGALMKSSGLVSPSGAPPRPEPSSVAASDVHADIVELDATHEVNAGNTAQPLATPPAKAAQPFPISMQSVPDRSGRPSAENAPASSPMPDAVEIVTDAIVNASGTASQDALRSDVIRAALEWVAADQHNIGATPGPDARGPATDSEHIEIETAHTRGPPTDPTPAQTVRSAPSPTPPAVQAGPAAIAEEVVEISIGTIHVRVDAPASTTAARIAPHEGAQSRPSPARPTAHSALSRRALRRI